MKLDLRQILRRWKWEWRVRFDRGGQRIRFPGIRRETLPILIGNAMAKSGSHILAQFLEGISQVSPMVFTDLHPIRTIAPDGRRRDPVEVLADIGRLRRGDIGWGYIPSREPYLSALSTPEFIQFFVYRDPRDKIISHIFYAMDIHEGHAMRSFYREQSDMAACIDATIKGVDGMLEDIRTVYESYLGWLNQERVMCLRFEDLVDKREASLDSMLSFLAKHGLSFGLEGGELIRYLNQIMSPVHSPTFRKGQSGGWREYFTPGNIELLKAVSGDLLVRLGYEQSMAWTAEKKS
jgi:hypothetical protein